jgi:hypothetical protein
MLVAAAAKRLFSIEQQAASPSPAGLVEAV